MMVRRAPRVERCRASGACRTVVEVLRNAQTIATGAAEHRFRIAATQGPDLGGMVGDRLVAVETRYPQPAAFHAQRDDVVRPSPVRAASNAIDIDPVDRYSSVDAPHIPAALGEICGLVVENDNVARYFSGFECHQRVGDVPQLDAPRHHVVQMQLALQVKVHKARHVHAEAVRPH